MQYADPAWGGHFLGWAYAREEAEERWCYWAERARAIPGAEVRVWLVKDPIGGESFMFHTRTPELVPEEWRRPVDPEKFGKWLREQGLISPFEDGGAIDTLDSLFRGPRAPDEQLSDLEQRLDRLRAQLDALERDPPPDAL
jgi:hypothetical protein